MLTLSASFLAIYTGLGWIPGTSSYSAPIPPLPGPPERYPYIIITECRQMTLRFSYCPLYSDMAISVYRFTHEPTRENQNP